MGYCHVNQPLFLAAGVSTNSLVSFNIMVQTHLVFEAVLQTNLKYKSILCSASYAFWQVFFDNFNEAN